MTEKITRAQAEEALEELEELAVCGHNENAASRHTIRNIASMVRSYLAQQPTEDVVRKAHEARESLGRHFHCDECNDTGVVALGEHFVTHEMALDAGEPQMEGQSMGIEEGPCPRCGGAEAQQHLANLAAALPPLPEEKEN